jgi:hypothetical protein
MSVVTDTSHNYTVSGTGKEKNNLLASVRHLKVLL